MLTSFICKGCGKPSTRERYKADREPQYCTNECYHASPAGRRRRGPANLPGTRRTGKSKPRAVLAPHILVAARVRRWCAMPSLYAVGGLIE